MLSIKPLYAQAHPVFGHLHYAQFMVSNQKLDSGSYLMSSLHHSKCSPAEAIIKFMLGAAIKKATAHNLGLFYKGDVVR